MKANPEKSRHPLSRPVVVISVFVASRLGAHPIITKYTVAVSVALGGALMATNPLHGIPHFLWDGIAYTIHGLGAAPIVEAVLRRIEKASRKD